MSELLKEAGWKKVLAEKKNLGLKVMGTGVSKKLRDCETLYAGFTDELKSKGKDFDDLQVYADNYLHSIAGLITHLSAEVGKHPLFPTAMAYLKSVLAEAKKREVEVKTRMKLEKEQWKQKGKEVNKPAVKLAPQLSDLKKLFVAANVALTKAAKIDDLIGDNLPYQTVLKKIANTKGISNEVQNSVTILRLNPKQKKTTEFTKLKEEMVKTLNNAVAVLPKS